MIKKIFTGYYSRMLFVCIITVCTITAVLFSVSSTLLKKREENDYLKDYDIAISNLASIMAAKENRLANTLAPLYSSASRYQTLCRLYDDETLSDTDINQSIIPLFAEICRYDTYCKGILVITKDSKLYHYNIEHATLSPLPDTTRLPYFKPYEISVMSQKDLQTANKVFDDSTDTAYGLSATIFNYNDTALESLGQLVILYSTSEFGNYIDNADLSASCDFTIMNANMDILYSSAGNYTEPNKVILKRNDTAIRSYQSAPELQLVGGRSYYHATAYDSRHSFYTTYQLPEHLLSGNYSLLIIGALCIAICLASIGLYLIILLASDKKIKSIQGGMGLIGGNNLTYRLPVPKGNDEFAQITRSFNHMCDELQTNVEKAYLYEISQKKAELYAMQVSINPHFLYNTLEQIRYQITKGAYPDASKMLLLLSRLYRSQTRRNLYISIGEELSLCENLINLYMYRYENFEYEFIVGSALKIYALPKNTLQPLIENYFVHGLVAGWEDNYITISVQMTKTDGTDLLEIAVENNGHTITDDQLLALRVKLAQPVLDRKEDSGFALSNVNARLKIVFGASCGLNLMRGTGGKGFRISFKIPPVTPEWLTNQTQPAEPETPVLEYHG